MAIQSKAALKAYFETGDVPTQTQFSDLIDSLVGFSPASSVFVPTTIGVGGGNHVVFDAPMPVGPNYTKTSPFRIVNNATYFGGLGPGNVPNGWDSHQPDQPFALGRMPAGQNEGQDPTYSLAYWVHEVDYMVGPFFTSQERYDVVRCAGPGSDVHWDYPSGDYPDARRCGYAYEAFSNDQGNHSAGTISAGVYCDGFRWESNYCNPHNPSVGELGQFGYIAPNQVNGTVTFGIGSRLSQNLIVTASPTSTRLAASGTYQLDGSGTVSLIENSQNLFIRMNRIDEPGSVQSKQIEIYADGAGKSIRLGSANIGLTITQNSFLFEGANVSLSDGYGLTASALRVTSFGVIDFNAVSPNKTYMQSDGYALYGAALEADGTTSYAMFGSSAYWKSFTLKPEMRIGWNSTLGDKATAAFRLNSGVIEAVNASDNLIDFRCNNITFGTHTSNTDAAITGYVTITDAAGNPRKLAVIT